MSDVPDLAALRALAGEATPGPWEVWRTQSWTVGSATDPSLTGIECYGERPDEDAAFIAAANPAVVLALLDRLEAAEEESDEAIVFIQSVADLNSHTEPPYRMAEKWLAAHNTRKAAGESP